MAACQDSQIAQNQFDRIVRNKVIYQKVATALGPFSTPDPFSAAPFTSALSPQPTLLKSSHKVTSSMMPLIGTQTYNKIYVPIFAVSYESHMNRSKPHAFT